MDHQHVQPKQRVADDFTVMTSVWVVSGQSTVDTQKDGCCRSDFVWFGSLDIPLESLQKLTVQMQNLMNILRQVQDKCTPACVATTASAALL